MEHTVKCIYCFGKFTLTETHFRAAAPAWIRDAAESELQKTAQQIVSRGIADLIAGYENEKKPDGDKEIKKDDGYAIDQKLKSYMKYFLDLDESTSGRNARQYMSFAPGDKHVKIHVETDPATKRDYNAYAELSPEGLESESYRTDICLCPHCHNVLPQGFGRIDTLIISFIGDTNSGKTVFMTVLINELLQGNNSFDSSLSILSANDIKKHIKAIYSDKTAPKLTDVKAQPPSIFNYRYYYGMERTEKFLNIVIYDIAGENCRESDKLKRVGLHVQNSDGIIFILNPTAIDNIAKHLMPMGLVKAHDTDIYSQRMVIDAISQNFTAHGSQKSKIPLALVLSKIDMLSDRNVNIPFFDNNPYSKLLIYNNSSQAPLPFLNKAEIQDMNDDVLDFLAAENAGTFISWIRNSFERNCFFAVSALGQTPVDTEVRGERVSILNREIKPFRVTDPFNWILAQNGYLDMQMPDSKEKPKGIFSFLKKKR